MKRLVYQAYFPVYPAQPPPAVGSFAVVTSAITVRPKFTRAALFASGSFFVTVNPTDIRRPFSEGWPVQPWQPPHPRREKAGALMKGDDGIQKVYAFLQALIWRATAKSTGQFNFGSTTHLFVGWWSKATSAMQASTRRPHRNGPTPLYDAAVKGWSAIIGAIFGSPD